MLSLKFSSEGLYYAIVSTDITLILTFGLLTTHSLYKEAPKKCPTHDTVRLTITLPFTIFCREKKWFACVACCKISVLSHSMNVNSIDQNQTALLLYMFSPILVHTLCIRDSKNAIAGDDPVNVLTIYI